MTTKPSLQRLPSISMNHLHKNCSKKDYKRHSDANSVISLPCLLSSALKHLSLCISRSYSLPIIKYQVPDRKESRQEPRCAHVYSFIHPLATPWFPLVLHLLFNASGWKIWLPNLVSDASIVLFMWSLMRMVSRSMTNSFAYYPKLPTSLLSSPLVI